MRMSDKCRNNNDKSSDNSLTFRRIDGGKNLTRARGRKVLQLKKMSQINYIYTPAYFVFVCGYLCNQDSLLYLLEQSSKRETTQTVIN